MQIYIEADDIIKEDTEDIILEKTDYLRILVLQAKSINHGWNPTISQLYFNTSYHNAVIILKSNKQISKLIKMLPLHNKNHFIILDNIIDNIKHEQDGLSDLFTKKSRINALKNNNHYFAKFHQENIKNEQNDFIQKV
ncbi:MAG: hypothetical protein FAF04_00995 [Epsilonproteobacteria bacterium]|nr:hypothetical protein [Campylobacterota bacterium]